MKKLAIFLMFSLVFISLVFADSLPPVEKVEFDWNKDHKLDQFILEPAKEGSFKGSYIKLRIKIPGKPEFTLENEAVWDSYHNGVWDDSHNSGSLDNLWVYKTNIIESDYFAFLPVTNKDTFLFLFGYAYASSPGDLYILALNNELIFKKQFEMAKFEDINHDGISELIGIPCSLKEWSWIYKLDSSSSLYIYKRKWTLSSVFKS